MFGMEKNHSIVKLLAIAATIEKNTSCVAAMLLAAAHMFNAAALWSYSDQRPPPLGSNRKHAQYHASVRKQKSISLKTHPKSTSIKGCKQPCWFTLCSRVQAGVP